MADVFNSFFVEKIANLRSRVKKSYTTDPMEKIKMTSKPKRPFTLRTTTEENVIKLIKATKSKDSAGMDDISSKILKMSAEVLSIPLTRVINTSITTGVFPKRWKIAKVTPVLKKGDSKSKSNYRPVALLPAFSKVLEAVVHQQIMFHVEKEGILPRTQHGFRRHRSTNSALLYLTSKWEEWLQRKLNVGMLVFDLSAAFDCLDAEILDKKLEHLL